jgi:hypothetical protein
MTWMTGNRASNGDAGNKCCACEVEDEELGAEIGAEPPGDGVELWEGDAAVLEVVVGASNEVSEGTAGTTLSGLPFVVTLKAIGKCSRHRRNHWLLLEGVNTQPRRWA